MSSSATTTSSPPPRWHHSVTFRVTSLYISQRQSQAIAKHESSPKDGPAQPEHLNIKVTDNNNEVFFKINYIR